MYHHLVGEPERDYQSSRFTALHAVLYGRDWFTPSPDDIRYEGKISLRNLFHRRMADAVDGRDPHIWGTRGQRLRVSEGTQVRMGQLVGYSGTTGFHSRSVHLHFTIARISQLDRWALFDPWGIYGHPHHYAGLYPHGRLGLSAFAPILPCFVGITEVLFDLALAYYWRVSWGLRTVRRYRTANGAVAMVGSFVAMPAAQYRRTTVAGPLLPALDGYRPIRVDPMIDFNRERIEYSILWRKLGQEEEGRTETQLELTQPRLLQWIRDLRIGAVESDWAIVDLQCYRDRFGNLLYSLILERSEQRQGPTPVLILERQQLAEATRAFAGAGMQPFRLTWADVDGRTVLAVFEQSDVSRDWAIFNSERLFVDVANHRRVHLGQEVACISMLDPWSEGAPLTCVFEDLI